MVTGKQEDCWQVNCKVFSHKCQARMLYCGNISLLFYASNGEIKGIHMVSLYSKFSLTVRNFANGSFLCSIYPPLQHPYWSLYFFLSLQKCGFTH